MECMSEKNCESSFRKLILIGVTVGVISGFGAYLFFKGLEYSTAFVMESLFCADLPLEGQTAAEIAGWTPPPVVWLILPIICGGALLSGLIVYFFAPETEGHGTDAAILAYHDDGKIRWRVPIVKAVASIITISIGGSAGREGPTAQIAAGFGAFIADVLTLSPRERKIAIATGIGAGIGTIFKAPLGGAILAAEILYLRDFEADVVLCRPSSHPSSVTPSSGSLKDTHRSSVRLHSSGRSHRFRFSFSSAPLPQASASFM